MCLQIPWTNLGKSAVVVYIDRLYILAGPKTETASAEDGNYEVSSSIAAISRILRCLCWSARLPL